MSKNSFIYSHRQNLGFTLVELIVVIAIIGILATLSVVALNNARAKSRDERRVADTKQLTTALAMYYGDTGRYPAALIVGQPLYSTSLDANNNIVTTTYLALVPANPNPADGANCTTANNTFNYSTSSDLQTYTLSTCVSVSPQDSQNSIYISDPQQTQPCGVYVVNYAGQVYRTVQIGTQCWMKDSLNIGTAVAVSTNQTNNGVIEKYCYSDSNANCVTYGGLYQWNEAMNYSTTEGAQGICPPGWHIPTDAEQNTLDQYLTTAGQSCNASRSFAWGCLGAGTRLKDAAGFNALMVGSRWTDNVYYYLSQYVFYWSSTISGATAWTRNLGSATAYVNRYNYDQNAGYSVRCIKN
jgi:uncharacterized protein (TIGR02145 family)/prepilin-type N-terminal cleavage/methylation domain-containing protein